MAMLAYEAAPRPRVTGLRMPGIGGLGPSDALGHSPRPRGIPDINALECGVPGWFWAYIGISALLLARDSCP